MEISKKKKIQAGVQLSVVAYPMVPAAQWAEAGGPFQPTSSRLTRAT